VDCAGECGGELRMDQCGVCGGDGQSCVGCMEVSACNFDAAADTDDGAVFEVFNGGASRKLLERV
jgi:hypothetical protein